MIRMSLSAVTSAPAYSNSNYNFDLAWQTDAQLAPDLHSSNTRSVASFFAPARYEKGYAYPLVVWLHSDRSSERELGSVLPELSSQNFVGAAPRGTVSDASNRKLYNWSQSGDHIAAAGNAVDEVIQRAQCRFHVNPERIFLVGYGSGGQMAMRLALNAPEAFAGVISIHGPLPSGRNLLGRLNAARGLPVMLVAGVESQLYPQQKLCEDLRLLHAAGTTNTVLHTPGGDDLCTEMLRGMNEWIMTQPCSSASVVC